jgi:hypothetical protein
MSLSCHLDTTHALGLDVYLYNWVRDPEVHTQYNHLTHMLQYHQTYKLFAF